MKKILCVILSLAFVFSFSACTKSAKKANNTADESLADIDTKNISINFRAVGDYFYQKKDSKWSKALLKGVNMGLTEATTDLANPNVSYDTYIDWFNKIADMNANTVKVFTIMNPDFYKALYDFNASAKEPLYLLQGIWFSEDYLYDIGDAFDSDSTIVSSFKKSINETIDVIHGKSDYTTYGNLSPAIYSYDVSKYTAGYILGLEWPADFVIATNKHENKKSYAGTYLKTNSQSSAFEAFLCQMGDTLIKTESKNYSCQTPVAFLNWSTTDVINHSNEPFDEEDAVSVNTENIVAEASYYTGLFAAIDIYPYYPEFLNYQGEYLAYKDASGKSNPYEAYLKDLKTKYSVPIIVAEFGVPTSRGVAHNSVMGYNQGGITEEEQGNIDVEMMKSIVNSSYAGAMIFSWQDEWFKQTWNTIKYSPDTAESRTPNVQSAEQSYGILAMESGRETACYVDGVTSDWDESNIVVSNSDYTLYSKYDEGYLYFCIKLNKKSFDSEKLYIPISTVGVGSKFSKNYNLSFDKNVDFIVSINGKSNTKVVTDAYYDAFQFVYGKQKQAVPYNESNSNYNSGIYNSIYTFTSNEIYLPDDKKTIKPQYYESGKLTFGVSNPTSKSYNSLADFYYDDNVLEMRIPWYLLNVQNSTNRAAISNLYKNADISYEKLTGVHCGVAFAGKSAKLYSINYSGKSKSDYHTRLKQSYDIIKEYYSSLK